ncbi:MAG: hypothetical protein ISR90_01700 [Candidatus Marinimicrobia bacterium]|nr:hypothetical protein [Candidatus Neomarinimicrobiota bacterium]MBL7022759.1 hypothetical protein [Candidatus Neomarinimicrobiota bacterium]MBL7109720.1 hypothetical protein [Candidatus Neomarinimicrobiota bacterium]
MFTIEIIGVWLAVLLTFSIFSYLYDDNPFYKAAEHLFVGVSAGYVAAISFWQQVQPNLFGRLWPQIDPQTELSIFGKAWYFIYDVFGWITSLFGILERGVFPKGGIEGHSDIRIIYVIPFILGIFMLLRLFPKVGWLARWAIAYIVGMASGLRLYAYLNSNVIEQIKASGVDFSADWFTIINKIIILVGTIAGLMYFFFSKEHKGVVGKISRIGIYFLMISFGAHFGFTVMGRISLLIGRIYDLIKFSVAQYYNATFWIMGIMIIILAIWAFKKDKQKQPEVV